jgi:hypothetical protein
VPDIAAGLAPVARWPDAAVSWRHEEKRFHIQFAGIVRELAIENPTNGAQSASGWGATASGSVNIGTQNLLKLQVTHGEGLGRYLQDLTGSGLDAALDAQGRLRALEASGIAVGFKHRFTPTWQTNLAYGSLKVANQPSQGALALSESKYEAANLIYKPSPHVFGGVELLHGSREVASGTSSTATRVQFTVQYDLFK